jgi:hypothetical protein
VPWHSKTSVAVFENSEVAFGLPGGLFMIPSYDVGANVYLGTDMDK